MLVYPLNMAEISFDSRACCMFSIIIFLYKNKLNTFQCVAALFIGSKLIEKH